jgi:hypothetical protein
MTPTATGTTRTPPYTGTNRTLIVGCVQLEPAAPFPSSPIITTGAATNRDADEITGPLAPLGIPASGASALIGTAIIDIVGPAGMRRIIAQYDDGTAANRVTLSLDGTSVVLTCVAGGVQTSATVGTITVGTLFRYGVSPVGDGTARASLNGAAAVTVAGAPAALTTGRIGIGVGGVDALFGEAGTHRIETRAPSAAALAAMVAAAPE